MTTESKPLQNKCKERLVTGESSRRGEADPCLGQVLKVRAEMVDLGVEAVVPQGRETFPIKQVGTESLGTLKGTLSKFGCC